MKRLFARMAAALLAAILIFPVETRAISAEHAIVTDATTGRILYEKESDHRGLIASTTKIMTALIVCEQSNILDRVRIPKEAVGIEGSSMYLREGEILTIQELLYGLMLHSGNDAAIALAIYCGGTVEDFVALMNDKAHRLGLENTHFENPHGLDSPGHYSTAHDMAILSAYAMNNPIFYQTVSTKTCNLGQRFLRNHNKLLWRVDGADGIKTGFTKAAGRILVSSATRKGRRLICVTMNDPNDWQDHATLLNNGFSQYTIFQIVSVDTCIGTIDIAGGSAGEVSLFSKDSFHYPLSEDESVTIILQPQAFVYAPVVKGSDAGVAYICVDGEPVGKISLYYGETIEQYNDDSAPRWKKFFQR